MPFNARPTDFENNKAAATESDRGWRPANEASGANPSLFVDRDPYTDLESSAASSGRPAPDLSAPLPPAADGTQPTAGHFILHQNEPNPYGSETAIPFTLSLPSDVRLELFDQQGRKVTGVWRRDLSAGPQHINLNLEGLGLAPGEYVYQLQVTNRSGIHRQHRTLTTLF